MAGPEPPAPKARPRQAQSPAGWLAWWPAPAAAGADWGEQLRVVLGAMLGILVAAVLCRITGAAALPMAWA